MLMRLRGYIDLIQVFEDTIEKCEQSCSFFSHDHTKAEYYDIQRVNELARNHVASKSHADIRVSPDDSYVAALRMKKEKGVSDVLVLNMANSVSPGGGVSRGAEAQEEDLCRTSSLWCSLTSREGKRFYAYNKYHLNKQGSDTAIYSPHVYVIKDCHYNDIRPVEVSVLTMAVPVYSRKYDAKNIMDERIYKMLCIAEDTGHKNLVLGAWGCGAFGNDPNDVAQSFKKHLAQFDFFDHVEFAVMPGRSKKGAPDNYSCFVYQLCNGGDNMGNSSAIYDKSKILRNEEEYEELQILSELLKSDVELGLRQVIKNTEEDTPDYKTAQEFLCELGKADGIEEIEQVMDKWWDFVESEAYRSNMQSIIQYIREFVCSSSGFDAYRYYINGEFDIRVKMLEAKGIQFKDAALVGKPTISSQKQSFTEKDLEVAERRLIKNFCNERIEDIKNISKYIYSMRVEALL